MFHSKYLNVRWFSTLLDIATQPPRGLPASSLSDYFSISGQFSLGVRGAAQTTFRQG
jgi:hypothetical protein